VTRRARDERCVLCGRAAESLHERVPRSRGGPRDRINAVPLCGSGTTGCHGWAEARKADAERAGVYVRGEFRGGRYVGPYAPYRWHYNGEAWNPDRGWVDAYAPAPHDGP